MINKDTQSKVNEISGDYFGWYATKERVNNHVMLESKCEICGTKLLRRRKVVIGQFKTSKKCIACSKKLKDFNRNIEASLEMSEVEKFKMEGKRDGWNKRRNDPYKKTGKIKGISK